MTIAFGRAVRVHRLLGCETLEALSQRSGVFAPTLSLIERGRREPTPQQLTILTNALSMGNRKAVHEKVDAMLDTLTHRPKGGRHDR